MLQLLISMFGFLIVYRILSQLQKFEVLNRKKMIQLFVSLQVPFYFPLYFKELFPITLTFIGIFLMSLMFFGKILEFFAKRTLKLREISFIDEIILLMKTGKSAHSSLKTAYLHLSSWEKNVFKPILFCFEHENMAHSSILQSQKIYFQELERILKLQSRVVDQLISFREGLKVQRNLRHRSGQVAYQIRAQATVATIIYIGIFILSWHNFNLREQPIYIFISLSLFCAGQILIFTMGGRIKWRT